MKLSIIIPVFNEEENINELYDRITTASSNWDLELEIVMIDDGSSDRTFSLLKQLHQGDPRLQYVSFSRNFGHQVAVTAGLRESTGDAVVIIDADLQDPPEEIHRFIEKWREGYQVVYGVRRRRKEGVAKRSAYFLYYRILRLLTPIQMPLDSGDFCLMDRTVVDQLNAMPERNRFVRGLRSWIGFRQTGLEYERQGRSAGEPKYSLSKLMRLAFDGIVNFSYRPLQLSGLLGFLISGLSFAGILFFLLHRLLDFKIFGYSPNDVPGFTSLILAVLFLGGIQLITLGVFGEYLGRIFDEVKQRPLYIVKESSSSVSDPANES